MIRRALLWTGRQIPRLLFIFTLGIYGLIFPTFHLLLDLVATLLATSILLVAAFMDTILDNRQRPRVISILQKWEEADPYR